MRRTASLLLLVALFAPACGGGDGEGANLFFGKELIQRTTTGGGSPSWSPDGNSIAYMFNGDVWMVAAEEGGGDPVRVTTLPGQELHPYWHPESGNPTLVFVAKSGEDYKLMTVDVNTSETTEIYSTSGNVDFPSFTSDGEKIVYCGVTKGYGIRWVAADGSSTEASKLDNDDGWDTVISVRCSPIGAEIMYVERRGPDYNIYTITLDNSKPTALTNFKDIPTDKHQIWDADWSRDVSRIAYSHSANIGTGGRSSAIYTMDAGGGNITGWTFDPATIHEDTILFMTPSFAPDGNRLACQHAGDIWIMVLE